MITLNIAKKMLDLGKEEAQKLGVPCSIAIVDENGWLIALHRMDRALTPTADIARDKAWTAAMFRMPSEDIIKFGNPSSHNSGFNTQNWNDRLTTIPGGLPIEANGKIIGGVGVCGGTQKQDAKLCHTVVSKNI